MPLVWPTLPDFVTQTFSLVLFIGTLALKYLDLTTIYSQLDSHCIAGWEITDKLATHMRFMSLSIVPDGAFVVCILIALCLKRCNFGADPGTIVYNIIVGIFCILSMGPITAIEECGNAAIPVVKSVALYSQVSGILHFGNGLVCLLFLAPKERTMPARRPHTSAGSMDAT